MRISLCRQCGNRKPESKYQLGQGYFVRCTKCGTEQFKRFGTPEAAAYFWNETGERIDCTSPKFSPQDSLRMTAQALRKKYRRRLGITLGELPIVSGYSFGAMSLPAETELEKRVRALEKIQQKTSNQSLKRGLQRAFRLIEGKPAPKHKIVKVDTEKLEFDAIRNAGTTRKLDESLQDLRIPLLNRPSMEPWPEVRKDAHGTPVCYAPHVQKALKERETEIVRLDEVIKNRDGAIAKHIAEINALQFKLDTLKKALS